MGWREEAQVHIGAAKKGFGRFPTPEQHALLAQAYAAMATMEAVENLVDVGVHVVVGNVDDLRS